MLEKLRFGIAATDSMLRAKRIYEGSMNGVLTLSRFETRFAKKAIVSGEKALALGQKVGASPEIQKDLAIIVDYLKWKYDPSSRHEEVMPSFGLIGPSIDHYYSSNVRRAIRNFSYSHEASVIALKTHKLLQASANSKVTDLPHMVQRFEPIIKNGEKALERGKSLSTVPPHVSKNLEIVVEGLKWLRSPEKNDTRFDYAEFTKASEELYRAFFPNAYAREAAPAKFQHQSAVKHPFIRFPSKSDLAKAAAIIGIPLMLVGAMAKQGFENAEGAIYAHEQNAQIVFRLAENGAHPSGEYQLERTLKDSEGNYWCTISGKTAITIPGEAKMAKRHGSNDSLTSFLWLKNGECGESPNRQTDFFDMYLRGHARYGILDGEDFRNSVPSPGALLFFGSRPSLFAGGAYSNHTAQVTYGKVLESIVRANAPQGKS